MPQSGRLKWLDTARGTAMLFVCLAHFSSAYFVQFGAGEAVPLGVEIGKIAAPIFVALSGILFGVLSQMQAGDFEKTRNHVIDKALFMLVIAHPLMALMHTAHNSYLSAFGHAYITDTIAVCVIMGSILVPTMTLGTRFFLSFVVYVVSTAVWVTWEPESPLLLVLRDFVFGSNQPDFSAATFPYLPWFSLYLFGTGVGEVLARSSSRGQNGRTLRVLMGCSVTALASAVLMRVIYKMLLASKVMVDDDLLYYNLFASPYHNTPPSPHYLLLFIGLGMGLLSLVYALSKTARAEPYLALLSTVGRNSLAVFVVQEGMYFYVLYQLARSTSLAAVNVWPVYFLASLAMVAAVALVADRLRVSRYQTLGYTRFLHFMRIAAPNAAGLITKVPNSDQHPNSGSAPALRIVPRGTRRSMARGIDGMGESRRTSGPHREG